MKHFHTIEKLDTGKLYILELASVQASDYNDATRGREPIPCVGFAGDGRIRAIADMSFYRALAKKWTTAQVAHFASSLRLAYLVPELAYFSA